MITDAELNKLEDKFETADLLRAVDEIDKMRSYLNDRDNFRPPEIRDDLLKLHTLGYRLINAPAKGEAHEFFDLAMQLDYQVFDLMESLEVVRDILTKFDGSLSKISWTQRGNLALLFDTGFWRKRWLWSQRNGRSQLRAHGPGNVSLARLTNDHTLLW